MNALASALYAGHHVGDYWVQTDHDAAHKGKEGAEGRAACLRHVATYTATQAVCLGIAALATGKRPSLGRVAAGLAVSAVTHYAADRREYGLMFKLARRIPGKARFLTLGVPRQGKRELEYETWNTLKGMTVTAPYDDNPSLGTGAWALDQSWHVFWGVFVAGLVIGDGE